jgi:hypothetical protein
MNRKQTSWAALAVLFGYFLYFAIPAIDAKFATDDPMNLRRYWARGFWRCLADNVDFWSGGYRPMGALFYLGIYRFANLNPVPYRIAALTLIAGTLYFLFRLVLELTDSVPAAFLAAILACGHPLVMVGNFYNTSFVYDILAGFFTTALLYFYLRFRADMTVPRAALLIALYLAAIDSKEIAAMAAVWILAYELIVARPIKPAIPAILIAITLLYVSGRVFGSHGLTQEAGYQLQITAKRFFANDRIYFDDLFGVSYFTTSRRLVAVWLILAAMCAVLRRRYLWWCWFAAVTATLPVAFTTLVREGGSLFLPLIALAMLAAGLFAAIPLRPQVRWTAAVVAAICFTWAAIPVWRSRTPEFLADHRATWSVISQLRALPSRPAPHSRILIVNDPFDDWDMRLIADVFWNDPSIDIDLSKKLDHPPDPAGYNWVLAFDGDTLRVVKTR